MGPSRIRTAIPAEFRAGTLRGTGQIKNLGLEGLFLGTRAIPGQGEPVHLRFRLPSGEPMILTGLVWWTTIEGPEKRDRAHGFGLRLIEQNEAYERAVGKMLG